MTLRPPARGPARTGSRALLAALLACAVALPTGVDVSLVADARPAATDLGPLRVSENGRYFTEADGTPFFWLADTAWSLFTNVDRDDALRYLDARAEQGFTVIQAVAVFPHVDGLGPNEFGDKPLAGGLMPAVTDGAAPADAQMYDFWDNVDFVVEQAAQRGMRIALLPVWADKLAGSLVTTANAKGYGEFLGKRYGDDVIWVLGGDAGADGVEEVWRALAAGIATGANGSPEDYTDLLMTYHPRGDQTSATWFHDDEWLSFNMLQGGHCRRWDKLLGLIDTNFSKSPAKPFVDGESIYEDHPICWKPESGFSTAADVRRNAYWSVFGGAAGHTYGHHAVWQFLRPGAGGALGARGNWTDGLDFPAAGQMQILRALMESRPYLSRVPDQSLLTSPAGRGEETVRATRDEQGSYLMVYTPAGRMVSVDTSTLSGSALTAWWYDPTTGTTIDTGAVPRAASADFHPPDTGEGDPVHDWVLVVDDAARGFGPPGTPAASATG